MKKVMNKIKIIEAIYDFTRKKCFSPYVIAYKDNKKSLDLHRGFSINKSQIYLLPKLRFLETNL